jgi:UDP-N-acetyl-D-mannosaminuronate dehydrogenase
METVAVVGLGRVGPPLLLSFAHRGIRVTGLERQGAVLDHLSAGPTSFSEAATQELTDRMLHHDRFERTVAVRYAQIGPPQRIAGTVEGLRQQQLAARGG